MKWYGLAWFNLAQLFYASFSTTDDIQLFIIAACDSFLLVCLFHYIDLADTFIQSNLQVTNIAFIALNVLQYLLEVITPLSATAFISSKQRRVKRSNPSK